MNVFLWAAAVGLAILGVAVLVIVQVVTHPADWGAVRKALIYAGLCEAMAIMLAGIGYVVRTI